MDSEKSFLHSNRELAKSVLSWLEGMRIGPHEYRMNSGADSTIFTSCFALFILHLFGAIDLLGHKEKTRWSVYINSFQDNESGCFIPDKYKGPLSSKSVLQLTTFCLDALDILGASARYDPFIFLKQYSSPREVVDYLEKTGCFEGRPTTGNMAMFLGILLTRKWQSDGNTKVKELLDAWFNSHEKTQNPRTGFWGDSIKDRCYHGFQNAFHQYVVFNYWSRPILYNKKIVDRVLSLQDQDGHFSPIRGGGGCWDFDAADILIHCGYERGYREKDIENALTRLFVAILNNQNEDGGFCETRKRPSSIKNALKKENLGFIFEGYNPYLWYYRFRSTLSVARDKRRKIVTHWTECGREWGQSDLWDTWFRCLALAEISKTINTDRFIDAIDWNFHKNIGLGYFKSLIKT